LSYLRLAIVIKAVTGPGGSMNIGSHGFWLFAGIPLLSAGLILLLAWPARRLGLVDHPSTRKHHPHPVPLVGGLAIWAAFTVGMLLKPDKLPDYGFLLGGMTLMTLVGFLDDIRPISHWVRLLFQILAVLVMGLADQVVLSNLGNLFGSGDILLAHGAWLFTLFAVVGLINALNMTDGLDGLAGGQALLTTGWLLLLCFHAPICIAARFESLLVLALAIAGFLVFNLRHPWRARASVFMGDAGSTLLGYVLAWFLIRMSQGEARALDPITAVWILALPLMDTVVVMIRRLMAGHSPFAADRQHLHFLLLGYGLSDARAVASLLLIAFGLGGVGVLAQWFGVPEDVRFYAFVVIFLLYFAMTTRMVQVLRNRLVIGT
jgi:UDP-GlcNAc:undecaprenyl-phosphate GlcNAc-1-phosphate transferase